MSKDSRPVNGRRKARSVRRRFEKGSAQAADRAVLPLRTAASPVIGQYSAVGTAIRASQGDKVGSWPAGGRGEVVTGLLPMPRCDPSANFRHRAIGRLYAGGGYCIPVLSSRPVERDRDIDARSLLPLSCQAGLSTSMSSYDFTFFSQDDTRPRCSPSRRRLGPLHWHCMQRARDLVQH